MAANFKSVPDAAFERAGQLRTRALGLAEVELHAFEPVLEAMRLPPDDPDRDARIAAARAEASRSPLQIAQTAAEVAELAAELARTGNPNLAGDAIAGSLLAEASAQAAARLVEINLSDGPDVAAARKAASRAVAARGRALGGP